MIVRMFLVHHEKMNYSEGIKTSCFRIHITEGFTQSRRERERKTQETAQESNDEDQDLEYSAENHHH